jgi:hypothetical protein
VRDAAALETSSEAQENLGSPRRIEEEDYRRHGKNRCSYVEPDDAILVWSIQGMRARTPCMLDI